ncbi:MAG: GNAT family N-acetyltransferase [Ilumatobacteraceae bacterium]
MTVTIRRGEPHDIDSLLALVEEYCAADEHRFDSSVARAGAEPLLANDTHGVIWLAESDGVVGGYAAVTWGWSIEVGGLDVVLDELFVRDRNRGIGSALIDHLGRDCVGRGVARIVLETEQPNERARRLYARHGYTADTSIWMAKDLR